LTIHSDSSSKIARKKNEIVVGRSSGLVEKSKHRLRKHQEKHESEREKARDDAVVEISIDNVLDLRPGDTREAEVPLLSKAKGVVTQANGDSGEDSDINSEVEEQERRLAEKKRKGKGKAKDQGAVKPFAQRDLVSLAFAGDKVVQV
jgi:U3 small nucleolar RNA-associated protein 14